MIGNDLVDLQAASRESRCSRKGYLEKLFAESEQIMIKTSNHPDMCIWTLWSMKESAYKIHSRKTGGRKFAPTKLLTSGLEINGEEITGLIKTEGSVYYTKTWIRTNYIYSIAAESSDVFPLIYTQLHFRPKQLDYRKYQPACVSHHGDYLALAFCY